MVEPLLILKMLHCRNISKQNTLQKPAKEFQSNYNSSSETEGTLEENICRVCMNEGHIPIYGNDLVEDVSEDLRNFGGIEIESDDAYTKYLCPNCYTKLQNAISFRKTAQKTDQYLRNPEIEVALEPIYEDDNTNGSDDIPLNLLESFEYKAKKEKKKRKFKCRRCNLEFKGFDDYQAHRLSDEHENFRQTCPICNKSFMYTSFRNHMKLHGQEKPYMCDFCGKKFRMLGQFNRHRATHIDDFPFKCSSCNYRGRFNECLKMHMRTHTGEKPYQCDKCPAKFVNKGNLTRHVLIHKDERDYKCDSCNRGFYTKRELELHLKVDHTGVKDHICYMCGKAFGYRRQMLKHQLKVHKREKMKGGRIPLYLVVERERRMNCLKSLETVQEGHCVYN